MREGCCSGGFSVGLVCLFFLLNSLKISVKKEKHILASGLVFALVARNYKTPVCAGLTL